MHGENLRNPVRVGRVGFMRWLPIGQVYSTTTFCILMQPTAVVDPCILKTNRSKYTSNLDPVYGDACSAKSFGVRASRSWSYEIWLSIVWRLGWSWCSKAGEWTAKLFCIANHSAGLQVFGDLISLPCRGRAAAPRKAQKRPPGHAPGQSLFYSSFFTWKSPIWYATNGDFHYLFLSKSFSP